MEVNLAGSKYTFLKDYQKESKYRLAFDNLITKVFGLSFEEWYRAGYWNDRYIPYTLFGESAVANASVNIMDFSTLGEQKRYIQIGTVATDENYRKKNLSRFLMENILQEWNKTVILFIFLLINPY